jgi:hypothetical protein
MLQITPRTPRNKIYPSKRRPRHCVIDLSPDLFDALNELARVEDLPLQTLVSLLINSGLSARLARMARRRA